jgi:hypothetical protein
MRIWLDLSFNVSLGITYALRKIHADSDATLIALCFFVALRIFPDFLDVPAGDGGWTIQILGSRVDSMVEVRNVTLNQWETPVQFYGPSLPGESGAQHAASDPDVRCGRYLAWSIREFRTFVFIV